MSKKSSSNKSEQTNEERQVNKKESFLRVCEPRLNKAVKAIHLVEMTASPSYESTPEQDKAVILALQQAVDKVKAAFSGDKKSVAGIKLPT